jgi:hypothetical protein
MLTSPASDDPVIALVAEKQRLIASMSLLVEGLHDLDVLTDERGDEIDKEADGISEKEVLVDKALIETKPTTLVGAAAGLRIAKYEIETFFPKTDDGYYIVLSMIDGALEVLNRETAS